MLLFTRSLVRKVGELLGKKTGEWGGLKAEPDLGRDWGPPEAPGELGRNVSSSCLLSSSSSGIRGKLLLFLSCAMAVVPNPRGDPKSHPAVSAKLRVSQGTGWAEEGSGAKAVLAETLAGQRHPGGARAGPGLGAFATRLPAQSGWQHGSAVSVPLAVPSWCHAGPGQLPLWEANG